jgi:uncharacterized membrane protein
MKRVEGIKMTFETRLMIFKLIVKPAEWWQAFWAFVFDVRVTITDTLSSEQGEVLERERREL